MGLFDDIFGGLFDFNGDGKTTWDEEWVAYMIMQDIAKENEKEDSSYRSHSTNHHIFDWYDNETDEDCENDEWRLSAVDNDYGIDPYDYDTEDEYLEAIEEAEKDEWRLSAVDNDYGIDPYDYDIEEDYLEAIEEAEKDEWRLSAIDNDFGIDPYDYDTEDEYLEAIKEVENDEYDEQEADAAGVISIPIKLTFSLEFPESDNLDPDKENDDQN